MAENTTEKKTTSRKKEHRTFETALQRIKEIVSALEDGSAPLDTALALYEEAVSLVRFCNEKLDSAEGQIKVLTKTKDGDLKEKDFLPPSSADTQAN